MSKLSDLKRRSQARIKSIKTQVAESRRVETGAILAGAASAGALSGYGLGVELGPVDVGLGAVVGGALLAFDGLGMGSPARAAGLGMVAFEIGSAVEELVLDMTENPDETDTENPDDADVMAALESK